MDNNEKAILKTLIYSNIFGYPLTKEELWYYAISQEPLEKKQFFSLLNSRSFFQKHSHYYFLLGQRHTVASRMKRKAIAKEKMVIAQHICAILSFIFFINFIGISGSLAVKNTEEKDDIDLFIITKSHTIWVTRFCIIIILEILRKRRKKFTKEVSNKVCVNLFIEESRLAFSLERQNIYTAHEITQVKPMFNRDSTYEKFLLANTWVAKYMPNVIKIDTRILRYKKEKKKSLSILVSFLLIIFNSLAKQVQLWYMKRDRKSEIITDTFLAFYTDKTEKNVLRSYNEMVKKYEI